MKKSNKKTLVLSVVAFVLILMSLVSFTYSWIDDIKLVEFQNDNLAQNGAPLKTGTDINATVNITKEDNTIDLGKILTNSDLMFQYEKEGNQYVPKDYNDKVEEATRHIKFDTNSGGTKKDPQWNDDDKKGINSKKGYFYESGGMHLSPCYSDGETFYFQRQGQTGYREGNKDDENVNYISFTAKVSSPDATTDFWFDSMPTIQGKNAGGSTVDVSNYARYAIIVDGECHVYSGNGTANTCNSALTGTTDVTGVRKTANYTYGDSSNKTAERGDNSNTLFTVQKGSTVNMTVKIWLEGGVNTAVTAADINLNIVSSWANTRKIWIDDKTTGGKGESWLKKDSAKLYVTFPELLKDINSDPAQWWNKAANREKGLIKELTKDTSSGKYYVEVPLVYNNEKMILYRCNSVNFNDDAGTTQRSEYNVYCWNWWQTNTPNTYVDETYTLYGGSKDSTATGYFKSISQGFTVTDKGYGTWGDVEEIKVFSFYNGNDLATKGDGKAMYVVDHSDENTSGETYIYEMYRSGTTASDPWKTYVPASSSKIQFRYFGGAVGLSWGYDSWGGANPQRRPLASTGLYAENATTYNLGAIFNDVNGWGFWSVGNTPIDMVYLVKNKIFAYENNLYANLYDDDNHGNSGWPGVKMTQLQDASGNNVKWKDGLSPVYKSDPARSGSSTIYNHLRFNNGNSNFDEAVKTGVLNVFPGCFYNPDDGNWYGAINDDGRAANTDDIDDDDDDGTTDVTTDVPTGDGLYAYGQLLGGSSYVEYAKFSSTGVGGYIVLNLTAGNSYMFTLSKKTGNNTVEYGNDVSGVGPTLSGTNKGEWRFINDSQHKQKIVLNVTTTGKYKISIKEVQSTNFNLEFEYQS